MCGRRSYLKNYEFKQVHGSGLATCFQYFLGIFEKYLVKILFAVTLITG